MATSVDYVTKRMQELYVYDLYGFRPERKPLAKVLLADEVVNCFATGVRDGLRRMLVVTDSRVIIVGNHIGSASDLDIIPRTDIAEHTAKKSLFSSSLSFTTTNGSTYTLASVSRRVLDMFNWALEQPIKEYD